ncbi:MAG: hypothetical protein MI810_23780 [Flavobacteriales bacterium]|nr:hypothetical protein [Flavobacteriales bacterium]
MKYLSLILLFTCFTVSSFAQVNQKDSQGRKQGVWKKPYPQNAVFRYVGQFKDDKPYGKFVYYYETGEVEAVIQFKSNGVSYSKMYHRSGYMMARGKYIDQKKDSTWVYYDDRGVVSYQEDYLKGDLHGQKVVYYEPVNGEYRIMEYSYWKNGLQHGEYKKYHPSKKLAEEGNFVDGNKEGIIKHYYPSGKLARLERYKYGVKHGYWIFYDKDGKQEGYHLYWEGVRLKGEALKKKEAELKAEKNK